MLFTHSNVEIFCISTFLTPLLPSLMCCFHELSSRFFFFVHKCSVSSGVAPHFKTKSDYMKHSCKSRIRGYTKEVKRGFKAAVSNHRGSFFFLNTPFPLGSVAGRLSKHREGQSQGGVPESLGEPAGDAQGSKLQRLLL